MNNSEKHIIENAVQKVSDGTATEEQKILAELYNAYSLRESLTSVYNKINPVDVENNDIKETFETFENSIKSTFDVLYDYCGSSYSYTVDNIMEYVSDVLTEKVRKPYEPKKEKLRNLFKIITCRQYMSDETWYTLSDIIDIIRTHDEDDETIKRQNLRLLITDCIDRGYFIEKDREHNHGIGGTRYFMKTNKEFI